MLIPKDPPGHYNQDENAPPALKLVINKINKNQPQQPINAPNDDDDEVVPIPHNMFDLDPVPETVEKWTKVMNDSPTKMEPRSTFHQFSNDNRPVSDIDDNNNDDDEIIPIPDSMFNQQPIPVIVKKLKMKPTTKPTPTQMSNTYACFDNNDNNEDANVTLLQLSYILSLVIAVFGLKL